MDEKDKRITSYHETGHALVALMVDESEPLHKITIIPRGSAYLGATMQLPEKDRFMEGKRKLRLFLRRTGRLNYSGPLKLEWVGVQELPSGFT